ncbi:MAG: hypothetical protein IMX02_08285 [Limnochordaceae bacterium]|nr:hypothetical protein [Limnochordaceae bacterium]
MGSGSSNPTDGVGSAGQAAVLYFLGNTGVQPDSLSVEVERTGAQPEPADGHGLSWTLFAEEGVLRVVYPHSLDEFKTQFSALRVRYRYTVSEGIYALGISVAAGSEKVYLNGELLRRETDYTIDYESGVLVLLRNVGPNDRLQVDFEYFRGGLGAATEYNRNVFGVRAAWTPTDRWKLSAEVFFEGDEPRPLVEPERARTMPNSHTVVALSGAYRAAQSGHAVRGQSGGQGPWAQLDVAFSRDVNPFDANARLPQLNEVYAIAGSAAPGAANSSAWVLLGHRAGLTVGELDPAGGEPRWHRYTTAAGLSGLTVYAIAPAVQGTVSDSSWPGSPLPAGSTSAAAWVLGTESGLTLISSPAGHDLPFDTTANWERRYTSQGLPSNRSATYCTSACRPGLLVTSKPWTLLSGSPPTKDWPGQTPRSSTWATSTRPSETGTRSAALPRRLCPRMTSGTSPSLQRATAIALRSLPSTRRASHGSRYKGAGTHHGTRHVHSSNKTA